MAAGSVAEDVRAHEGAVREEEGRLGVHHRVMGQ